MTRNIWGKIPDMDEHICHFITKMRRDCLQWQTFTRSEFTNDDIKSVLDIVHMASNSRQMNMYTILFVCRNLIGQN